MTTPDSTDKNTDTATSKTTDRATDSANTGSTTEQSRTTSPANLPIGTMTEADSNKVDESTRPQDGPDQGLTVSQDVFDNPDARVPDTIQTSVGADGVSRIVGSAASDGWTPAPVHATDEEIAAATERNAADDARREATLAAAGGDSQAAIAAQDELPKSANNPGLGGSQ